MKRAFSTWYNYLIGLGLSAIAAGVAIIPYFATSSWPFEYIRYTFLFSCIVIFGVGFIIQDLMRASHRHKTKNWVDKLPDQMLDKCWAVFAPAIVGSGLCLIAGLIFSIPGFTF